MIEAEIKASLNGITPEKIETAREFLGFVPVSSLHETDIYYNSPYRDFRKTDEALRIRCSEISGLVQTMLTYKGPKLDRETSTRIEYETSVGDRITAEKLLEALGYIPIFRVEKLRKEYSLGQITLCLDQVDGLGWFLELEILLSDEKAYGTSEEYLLKILDQLGVPRKNLTRMSYLELLMKNNHKI